MQILRKILLIVLFGCTIFMPAVVFADSSTFNVLFFKPATGRNAYMMLHSTDTLHQFQFQFNEYASYGYHPLEVRNQGKRIQGVTDYTLVSDFVGAFGILEWLQLGVDFPYAFVNEFRSPNAAATVAMKNKKGFSDLRFEIKARVLCPCDYPVGLAIVPFMSVPTGNDSVYLGDPGLTGGARIALDGRVLRNLGLTLNVGYQTGRAVTIRNVHYQHRFLLGGGINGMFKHGVSAFGEINADAAFSKFFSARAMNPVEGMAGVKWDIKKTGVTLSAAAGSCIVCGVKGARPRAVVGVGYRFNPRKYQEKDIEYESSCSKRFAKGLSTDEIYELKMKCPTRPSEYVAGVHDQACPKYYELSDLADLMMRCPSRPEDFVEGKYDEACQKVYTLSETYSAKEIQDVYTLVASEFSLRCPATPADFNPALHDEACPKYYDLKEMSGLTKVCPANPREYQPGVDDAACPKYYTLREKYPGDEDALIARLSKLDTDKDGINDYLDVCPIEPEDYEGFADTDGCPDSGVSAISDGEIQTYRPAYFDFNSANLSYDSTQVLDQVIGIVNETPWIRRVLVGGHADERGTQSANEKISIKRAQAVIKYMTTHGVRGNVTLTPVGYGARKPAALGKTEVDYAKNRRVVFTVATDEFAPKQYKDVKKAQDEESKETSPIKKRPPKKWR